MGRLSTIKEYCGAGKDAILGPPRAIVFIGHTPLVRGGESGQELQSLLISISHRDLVRAP